MPKLTLKAFEERVIATSKSFLSILSADAQFKIKSPEIGVLTGKTNRQFEVDNILSVDFVNETNTPIDIEYEIAGIRATSSGEANVSIQNEVVVKRIVEAIQVDANATVENGKMTLLPANTFIAIADMNIPANSIVKFANARAESGREVTIQIITDNGTTSQVRIGDKSTLANNEGVFLQGDIDNVTGYEWKTETDVYIRNMTGDAVTVTGGEQWRS